MLDLSNPIEALVYAVMTIGKRRIEQREFGAFGVYLRNDGTLGAMGVEGGTTVAELLVAFKRMAPDAMAFSIVVMVPLGGENGECFYTHVIEQRGGGAGLSCAIVREDPVNDDLDFEDEVHVPATPAFFVVRH